VVLSVILLSQDHQGQDDTAMVYDIK
jgi:hypothetical protein